MNYDELFYRLKKHYKRSVWSLFIIYLLHLFFLLHASDHTQTTVRLLAWRLQEKLPAFFQNPYTFERYKIRQKDEEHEDQIIAELFKPYESAIAAQNYQMMCAHHNAVHTVSWHPQEATTLASGSADKTICIWSVLKGLLARLKGHTDWVQSVGWHPDGKLLASGSADRTVRIWDVQASKLLSVLSGHEDTINAVSWNNNGAILASGSSDTSVCLWDARSGRLASRLCVCKGSVSSLAWHPVNNIMLASGDFDSKVNRWIGGWSISQLCNVDMQPKYTREERQEMSDAYIFNEYITGVHWHPDGNKLASSSCQGISIWDIQKNMVVKKMRSPDCWIKDVCWHPNGDLLTSAGGDGLVKVWDIVNEKFVHEFKHPKPVKTIDWNSDGTMLAAGTLSKDLYIWHKDCAAEIKKLDFSQALYIVGALKELDRHIQGCDKEYFAYIRQNLPVVFKRVLNHHAKQVASFKAVLSACQQEAKIKL